MTRRVVALGGGGFSMEADPRLDDRPTHATLKDGRGRPRVCFVPTASGDSDQYIVRFYAAFSASRCEPSHLSLFDREGTCASGCSAPMFLYVGGGNTANLLAVWRVHGLDGVLREAWEAGVVLTGVSAGALCWFAAGVTDSFGRGLARLDDGLGLLPGSMCPHYDGEALRRPRYHELVAAGLPGGYAADDGVGLSFGGTDLVEAVTSRPGARGLPRRADRRPGPRDPAADPRAVGPPRRRTVRVQCCIATPDAHTAPDAHGPSSAAGSMAASFQSLYQKARGRSCPDRPAS